MTRILEIEDKLQCLLDRQKELQERLQEKYNYNFTKEEAVIRSAYWAMRELMELVEEFGRYDKPWKKTPLNIDNIKEEAIDALHFFLNIFIYLDMDAGDIIEEYNRKWVENHRRHNLEM